MTATASSSARVSVDGKFFRLGEKKFYVKGVAYGPFAPNAAGQPFASPEQTAGDFAQIRSLGANLIRIYHVPGKWFLDLAAQHELKVLIDVPWNKHLCFLDSSEQRQAACETVKRAVSSCAGHPAVLAWSVANEIPPEIVRWSGAGAVADFIDDLVDAAKRVDPACLCTFTNFPPTEFLQPGNLDFVCFNVYLHDEQPFRNYLARLQMVAEAKPLLLGEFGVDTVREGEARQAERLTWQIERAFRGGLAGAVVFNFTDDWWRGGSQIADWRMGLTTQDRQPRAAFHAVQKAFQAAPYFPLAEAPKVSVVVACHNGERTLATCLDSLARLNYPNYEVLLVDDGSADATAAIARRHPNVRYFRHDKNLGLSVARNSGIAAATGDIIAFTDADCRADEDWLYYLTGDLLASEFAGIGGPNLLPPEDSLVAAAVMASPGGPAHVMLTDRQAEHIPGCNMAFHKWSLAQVGGFDPAFRRAGDDVDLCWRLQQEGCKIGFSPAAFVWHFRRSTVGQYLKQQLGYGEAEALLVRKHPDYFNLLGSHVWQGRIYTVARFGVLVRAPIIYRGLFASAGFQFLYASQPAVTLMLCTTLEYHVLVTLPLWVLTVTFPGLLPLALTSLLISLGVCVAAGVQAALPRQRIRWWSRPLVALLFFLQPIMRGWARYQGRLLSQPGSVPGRQTLDSVALRESELALRDVQYWSEQRFNRLAFVTDLLRRLDKTGWPNKSDAGWSEYDVEVYGHRWSRLQLTTVVEEHPEDKAMLRVRLRARWSLQAKVAFWTTVGFELLVCGMVAPGQPWLWLLPVLSLPALIWFLHREQRNLRSMMAVFLDEMAKESGLIKVGQHEGRGDEQTRTAARRAHEAPSTNIQAPEKLQ